MPYDWTTGKCKTCGKLVRDGQGIQEKVKDSIWRFCEKCFLKWCGSPAPASTDRAGTTVSAKRVSAAHAAVG